MGPRGHLLSAPCTQAGFSPACAGSASGADRGLSDELFGCLRPKPDPGPRFSQV